MIIISAIPPFRVLSPFRFLHSIPFRHSVIPLPRFIPTHYRHYSESVNGKLFNWQINYEYKLPVYYFHDTTLSTEGVGRAGLRYRPRQIVGNNKKVSCTVSLLLHFQHNKQSNSYKEIVFYI